MGVDIKTIILHCKTLPERKQNILAQMERHKFSNYSFYEEFDGNELTNTDIEKYHKRKQSDWNTVRQKLKIYETIHPEAIYTQRELNLPQISLTIKHGKVYELLAKESDEYFIIFEDDAILCDDFETRFYQYLSQTPNDWDIVYFGSGCNLKPKNTTPDKIVYKMEHPASRCTDSMLVKKTAVSQLAKTWFPFNFVCDWELGYQQFLHQHNVYWWEPPLVVQGSVCGLYPTTLR